MSNTITDVEEVHNKYGIAPNRIIDFLALMGDKVDNIPGVPSVGPKTATKLLQQYDSLEGVIAHADEVKGKLGEKLRSAAADLPLSYELATIKLDVDLDGDTPNSLEAQPIEHATLLELYQDLEFKTWTKELVQQTNQSPNDSLEKVTSAPEAPAPVTEKNYEMILTEQRLQHWLNQLKKSGFICL